MADKLLSRERYGEAFWHKHHEAWQQSALNQREYCEAHGIPLKAFGVSVHFSHACFFAVRTRFVLSNKFSGGERGCRQFANVTARLFGGRTPRVGFKMKSIRSSIPKLM